MLTTRFAFISHQWGLTVNEILKSNTKGHIPYKKPLAKESSSNLPAPDSMVDLGMGSTVCLVLEKVSSFAWLRIYFA